MSSLKLTLIALMLTGLFTTQATARDSAVDGLLIGPAAAGMEEYIAGDEMERNSFDTAYASGPPVVYQEQAMYSYPPPPPRHYRPRPYYRDHYRPDYRHGRVCRDVVVVNERHGRYYETYRTICRDRDDWHRPRYRDRYYDGGDRHYDDGDRRYDGGDRRHYRW